MAYRSKSKKRKPAAVIAREKKGRVKKVQKSKHHWKGDKPNPTKYFGFVYLITNKVNGRLYVGKKQYYSAKPGSSKNRKADKSRDVWNPAHWNHSNWHQYSGSSKDLNKDIAEFGEHNFKFEILHQHITKSDLNYAEAKEQMERDVLCKKMDNGEYLYYNKQIAPIRSRPVNKDGRW